MGMASALGLIFSVLVLLAVIIQLDVDRTLLLSIVPSAHSDLANWLVVIVALAGGIVVAVGVAIAGFALMRGR